jgi:hypothetical protein
MNGQTEEILSLVAHWTTKRTDARDTSWRTGKPYKQTYARLLVAEHGKIKLLHQRSTLLQHREHSAPTEF